MLSIFMLLFCQLCNDPVAVNKATIVSSIKHLLSFDFIGLFDQKTVNESLVSVDVEQYAFSSLYWWGNSQIHLLPHIFKL